MLRLPATPASLLSEVIHPALLALPNNMATTQAQCCLIAIAKQESNLESRRQLVKVGRELLPRGPARGLWQFEQGGVRGVKNHAASDDLFLMICRLHRINPDSRTAHRALERPENDLFACQTARLLLWTHPKPLPPARFSAAEQAFEYYEWLWRPGAASTPDGRADCFERFEPNWIAAAEAVS